jgi:hypothetical protein
MLIITLVFEKNANFFAENCRKSQKIVIITSTPGHSFGRVLPLREQSFVSSFLRGWLASVINFYPINIKNIDLKKLSRVLDGVSEQPILTL